MSPERFQHLLTLLGPFIAKQPWRSQKLISEAERSMLTFKIPCYWRFPAVAVLCIQDWKSNVSHILRETLQAIWDAVKKEYLAPPSTSADWIHIAKKYEVWNLLHCLGAIDGKRIMTECPQNAG